VTFRHALAHSRNLATIHVAQEAGYGHVADLWKRLGVGNPPKPYPSIALGVFEATPFEIATAYTLFPNGGAIRRLKHIVEITRGGKDVTKRDTATPRRVASPETTFLVTNMMRSVLNEGTAQSARANGFTPDAAGKTGTTNDLRDAWFVGFTPELLTVVWVGFDDNQPVGLSGSQAALPIWTQFMKAALAGRANVPFDVPDGITFMDIDRETGKLATPACPKVFHEAFISGTEPVQVCEVHR
jgi:membrane carboxypeptidase/penicillin-binding protein